MNHPSLISVAVGPPHRSIRTSAVQPFLTRLAMGFTILTSLSPLASADWPYWRGPLFDGTAKASGLPTEWDPDGGPGSNLLWKREDIGGICTPIEMKGRLYTTQRADAGTPREGEQVVCLDAKTGETIWTHKSNVWLSDVPAERIGWSSPVADPETDRVYVLGSADIFKCLDGKTGDLIWEIPLHEQFGMLSTYGGRTNFPVIHEDLVIISGIIINWGDYAKPNHRLLGLDKNDGSVRWFSGTVDLPDDTTYSAPSIVTINGMRQLIMGTGDGAIWSFQPRTGRPLWHYNLSMRGIFATPLVQGDRVYAGHSEENVAPFNNLMGGVVGMRVTGTGANVAVEELWKRFEVVAGYSEPVAVGNRLFLVDDRCKMWIFDEESGDTSVERESFVGSRQRSALLYADGKIYVTTENGRWAVVQPKEDGYEVLSKGRVRNTGFAASPIVAGGRLYFQAEDTLYCVSNETATQEDVSISESMGSETPVSENLSVAWTQIVPAETVVQPGQSVPLALHVFNELGQALPDPDLSKASFSVDGPGSVAMSKDGVPMFTANSDVAHKGVTITASIDGVEGIARVRIIPPLPWKFTFDGLNDPPVSWVGARYRHQIRDVDGSPALVKITTIPKGARSRLWMGPSELAEYTVSSDVQAKRMSDQLPDIGLLAHGYTMDMMGQSQQLQIRSWDAQLRMAKTVPFQWKEDQWYRMKLRVDIESEPPAAVAIVRGKIWLRDEAEPEDWTITARDESPILSGSPGLYGNAKVAEIYYDNIEVKKNED